jgi:hypothetical protein
MEHVFFARFDSGASADAAIRDLAVLEAKAVPSEVVVHPSGMDKHQLRSGETHTLAAAFQSALLSGTVGGVLGGVLVAPLLVGHMSLRAGLLLGLASAIYGLLAGALAGAEVIDPELQAMGRDAQQPGTVLSVVSADLDAREVAADAFRRHGATVRYKRLLL